MSQRILFTEQVQDLGGNSLPSLISTAANGNVIVYSANQNFNNTGTVNVAVTSNGYQANIGFTINAAAVAANVQAVMLSTVNTATAGQTVIPLSSPISGQNYLVVTVNGLLQIPGTHYTVPNSNNVLMSDALLADDVVEVREFVAPYVGPSVVAAPLWGTLTPPNFSNWLTANDGATNLFTAAQNVDGSYVVSANTVAGNSTFFYVNNVPAAAYDVQFCLTVQGNNAATGLPYSCVFIRNPANGAAISFGTSGSAIWSGFYALELTSKVQLAPSSIVYVTTLASGTLPFYGFNAPLWIRLTSSGAGVYNIYNSLDGIFWYHVFSLTSQYCGATPSQFGWACLNSTASTITQLRFLSYNGAVG